MTGELRLIAGLGNPGPEYDGTRHNAGFITLVRVAEKHGFDPSRPFKSSHITKGDIGGRPAVLCWPQTYMNLSGAAVQEVSAFYKIPPENILVIHDDMDLPVGRLKMDWGGSAAGHNGVASVMANLPGEFARLRVGIGRPPREFFPNGHAGYVLGRFLECEAGAMDKALDEAAAGAALWATQGLVKAQGRLNRRPRPAKRESPVGDL